MCGKWSRLFTTDFCFLFFMQYLKFEKVFDASLESESSLNLFYTFMSSKKPNGNNFEKNKKCNFLIKKK